MDMHPGCWFGHHVKAVRPSIVLLSFQAAKEKKKKVPAEHDSAPTPVSSAPCPGHGGQHGYFGEHASQAGRAGDAENASDRVPAEGAGATDIVL